MCIQQHPSSISGQKEKGQRFLSPTFVNTGRQHVFTELLIFSAVYKTLAFRVSPCAVLWELSRADSALVVGPLIHKPPQIRD